MKNGERAELLSFLQDNKVACHSFVDALTPGSETKGCLLLTAITTVQELVIVPVPWSPLFPRWCERAGWHLHTQWVALQERIPEFRTPEAFILASKPNCLLKLQMEILSLSSKICSKIFPGYSVYRYPWTDSPEQRKLVPQLATCTETWDLWIIVS